MTRGPFAWLRGVRRCERFVAFMFVLVAAAAPTTAQVQAIDGTIEGFVRDQSRALVVAASVRVANVDTGLTRQAVTDKWGRFRILVLPPGRYRVECSLPGFARAERTGLVVQAGEVVTLDIELEVGPVDTVVTVKPQLPLTRPGQIDAGRSLSSAEVAALPIVLRNPLNLVLLTPGVTGNDSEEILQPRLNANGAQMRNSFQIDGNSNTQRDRAGLRLMPISPLWVSELKITTSGFAPEFGQASGVIVNAVTPSVPTSGTASFVATSAGPLFSPGPISCQRLRLTHSPAPR